MTSHRQDESIYRSSIAQVIDPADAMRLADGTKGAHLVHPLASSIVARPGRAACVLIGQGKC
jgi:hypothetical protein